MNATHDLDPRDLMDTVRFPPGSEERAVLAQRLIEADMICPGFDCDGCRWCDESAHRRGGSGPVGPIGNESKAGGYTSNQFGTFRNHDCSEKQLAFIARLRAERGLVTPAGEKLTKKAATRLIDELLETPKSEHAPKVDPNRRSNSYPGKCVECGGNVPAEEGWIEKVNNKWVTHHEGDCPERRAAPAKITEDGMYQDPDGNVFKVQIAHHGSGNLYAKRLVLLDEPRIVRGKEVKAEFEYEAGLINRIDPAWKMDLNTAMAFGQLYGVCCNCGAVLTDDKPGGSIEEGIGPVCAQKF